MLDTSKTYFFGVATDLPDNGRKKPEQPECAAGDIMYYFAPGARNNGEICEVKSIWRDDDTGRIKVKVRIMRNGEEVETFQTNIRD